MDLRNVRRKYREQAEVLVGISLFVAIVSLCCGLIVPGIISGAISVAFKVIFE